MAQKAKKYQQDAINRWGRNSTILGGTNNRSKHSNTIIMGHGAESEDDGDIVIKPKGSEGIRLKADGEIYINGELVGEDMDVVNALREMLLMESNTINEPGRKEYLDKQKLKSYIKKLK